MSQVRELGDRALAAVRSIAGTRDAFVVVAAVLGLLAVVEAGGRGDGTSMDLGTAFLLGLLSTVPLVFLPTHPVPATLAVTLANSVLLASPDPPYAAGLLAGSIALYWLARRRSRRVVFPFLLPFVLFALGAPRPESSVALVLMTAAVLLGTAVRERGAEAASAAAGQATADTLLEYAARGERARIARELHDVVAHHISLIAVQAETARLTTPGLPAEGTQRLLDIGDTARSALTEMRRLLGVLREDVDTDTRPVRAPQPGLEQLNALVDEARASSGASTRLIVRGCVVPLDPGVQLTAYRIVQEALTNVRRHAPGAAADVELDFTAEALRVRIRDNGPGHDFDHDFDLDGAGGHGLVGMRERAAMVSGTLTVGRSASGGLVVEAVVPIPPDVP
ncbi:sensor histidine kinase [Kribbella steppae]|uniref:sensor histidine kinase n=1 Tax=Kribbella steppae TaxID=2512223 RepID=UPI0018EE6B7A|nr:sensor histidine kinase [Kribbella steppae]